MFLAIRHTTAYSYDHQVLLDPHIIRLTPRADSYKRLLERTLTIIPEPDGTIINLDYTEALSHLVWFKRKTSGLTVISRLILELNEMNPFDFIVYPSRCLSLPLEYPSAMAEQLKPFLLIHPAHKKVKDFTLPIIQESKNNVVEFVALLASKLNLECTYETRDTGEPHAPEKTLSTRRGSCRDLAVLYVAAARIAGLAARFVSGYYFDQSPKYPQLHAWAEVYIPGGGWRGYDPTLGLACYGHHIALSAGSTPSQAAAIEGAFLGKSDSQMEVNIEYEYLKQFPLSGKFFAKAA
jgi:transglutaminase-like putative cysteine protease